MANMVMLMNVVLLEMASSSSCLMRFRSSLLSCTTIRVPFMLAVWDPRAGREERTWKSTSVRLPVAPCRVICDTSRLPELTDSEKVRVRLPAFMSTSNATSCGGFSSSANAAAISGTTTGRIRLPFMSVSSPAVKDKKVVSRLTANDVTSLMLFKSGVVSCITATAELSLFVTTPPVRVKFRPSPFEMVT